MVVVNYIIYCKTLGYNVSINTRKDKLNIYKITCSLTKLRKPENILKKMIYLRDSEDEYVYDLETEHVEHFVLE